MSRIVPAVYAAYAMGVDHRDAAPEMELGLLTKNRDHWRGLDELCAIQPLDRARACSPAEFAAAAAEGRPEPRISPVEAAAELDRFAAETDTAAAELMGIPSSHILALAFGLGTMLAAVAGGLTSTFFPFTILSGATYQLKSFVICVLGGLGNPLGALVGGLFLGALEGIVPTFMPVSWVPVVEFVLFVLVLVVKPTGLLGSK